MVDSTMLYNFATLSRRADMPVSTWQKTGIPVIISLVLFFIVFAVLFFIVRKKRLQTKRSEQAAQNKIDLDDVEDRAAYMATRKH